jgi:hypothetical protein
VVANALRLLGAIRWQRETTWVSQGAGRARPCRELLAGPLSGCESHLPTGPPARQKVERLQHMLNATGLYGLDPLVEDGDWGPKAREAVEWFQKDRALPVNRKVDKATWAELLHYWLRQDMFG